MGWDKVCSSKEKLEGWDYGRLGFTMKPFFKLSWILWKLLREPSLVRLMNEKDLRNSYFFYFPLVLHSTLSRSVASEIGFALA